MPAIIHTDLADIAGAGLTKGSVTYVARREGASASGAATMILPIAHPVQIVDGLADSPPLQPGPAVVIVQSGYFYREYPVTVPDDDETYNLLELAEVEIDWDPHIVSKIAQYVADAQSAVGQAQEILDDVESGVVPDSGIAARIAQSGSATRTAVEDRVRAVGDGTYAPAFPPATTIAYSGGNVSSVTTNGVATTYTYNPDGTVATDTRAGVTRTYTYDGSGNLTGIAS